MQRHDVQVPLAEDDIGPLGLLGEIQSVEHPALGVDRGLRRVHILGLGLVQHPAAEGHHVALGVHHRQHQAVAELVVEPPVLALDGEARRHQLRLGVALGGHGGEEGIPAVRRGTHAELHGGGGQDLPLLQIRPDGGPLRLAEELVVKLGGVPVQVQEPLAAAGGLPVAVLLRDLHPGPAGQEAHSVRKGEVLLLHDEVDDAAALLAAEAVVDLLVLQDMEGGGLLIVEGAAAPQAPALGDQVDIGAHHVDDVVPGDELVHEALGKGHGTASFLEKLVFWERNGFPYDRYTPKLFDFLFF